MSIVQPEFEYVDRATETIRYLEHGWPTNLCRWHSHAEYELHLIVATRGKTFVGDYIGEFKPGSLFLVGPNLPHNWITDEHVYSEPVDIRDMLVQFSQESVDQLALAIPEFREMEAMFERDFAHSVPIDPDTLEKKPFWWRLGVNLSRLAAPVL